MTNRILQVINIHCNFVVKGKTLEDHTKIVKNLLNSVKVFKKFCFKQNQVKTDKCKGGVKERSPTPGFFPPLLESLKG